MIELLVLAGLVLVMAAPIAMVLYLLVGSAICAIEWLEGSIK
jgi:hypothetical protein